MATILCVENLLPHPAQMRKQDGWLRLLLRMEAWLDSRATRRALYRLDNATLKDLALSRADVERIVESGNPGH